jgi:hypothetical protein
MQPSVSLASLTRRRVILVAAATVALAAAAAASYVVVRMWRPGGVSLDIVAVEEAVAREQARTCPPLDINGDSGRELIEAKTALESARGLPPADALRAELAVLRTAVEYPACRPTLLALALASAMMKMAEEAIRATWTAPELTAADRAAAAAELATIDAAEPAIERIIEAETDWALVGLAPALRGKTASPMWQYSKKEAALQVRDVLRTRARLRAAFPAGTALAACANTVADRPDIGSYTLVLRRYVERFAELDALRADLR